MCNLVHKRKELSSLWDKKKKHAYKNVDCKIISQAKGVKCTFLIPYISHVIPPDAALMDTVALRES